MSVYLKEKPFPTPSSAHKPRDALKYKRTKAFSTAFESEFRFDSEGGDLKRQLSKSPP